MNLFESKFPFFGLTFGRSCEKFFFYDSVNLCFEDSIIFRSSSNNCFHSEFVVADFESPYHTIVMVQKQYVIKHDIVYYYDFEPI